MLFLMLLVGKIGHIGTLGAVPWILVLLPLVLDLIMDFLVKLGYMDTAIIKLRVWLKVREMKRIVDRQNKANGNKS